MEATIIYPNKKTHNTEIPKISSVMRDHQPSPVHDQPIPFQSYFVETFSKHNNTSDR